MTLDLEELAHYTCEKLLASGDLKSLCRHRGWPVPKGSKDDLVLFVAPRLLEPAGVARALGSLQEPWLTVLHGIAMSPKAPSLATLRPLITNNRPYRAAAWRQVFRLLADGLLNRGVVLAEDADPYSHPGTSRFERLRFRIPEAHRLLLPPFPVTTAPLPEGAGSSDPLALLRQALLITAGEREATLAEATEGLAARVAGHIRIDGEHLHVGTKSSPELGDLLDLVRGEWLKGGTRSSKKAAAARCMHYILTHLPPGQGVRIGDLAEALKQLDRPASLHELVTWCEEGWRAGQVVRAEVDGELHCAAAPPSGEPENKRAPAWRKVSGGLSVDLRETALEPVLRLAPLCRVQADKGRLLLRPDPVLLGRSGDELDSNPALTQARAASPAFEAAAAKVQARRGKTVLHVGLVVLEITDPTLRAVLAHGLAGELRELGGPYLAIPRSSLERAEALVRKEGYSPRRAG